MTNKLDELTDECLNKITCQCDNYACNRDNRCDNYIHTQKSNQPVRQGKLAMNYLIGYLRREE